MANKIENFISKWGGFKFSTGGTTGSDYLQFQKEFRSLLGTISKQMQKTCGLRKLMGEKYDEQEHMDRDRL